MADYNVGAEFNADKVILNSLEGFQGSGVMFSGSLAKLLQSALVCSGIQRLKNPVPVPESDLHTVPEDRTA